MKKSKITKMFIEAIILSSTLLLTGCPSPLGNEGGPETPHTKSNIFENDDWEITYDGLCAEIIDKDPVFAKWEQYGDALIDTHGKVLKLASHTTTTDFSDGNSKNVRAGISAVTIHGIEVSEESAISFDYKCDLFCGYGEDKTFHKNYLKVFIDNNSTPSFEAYGYKQMWQNASVILSEGQHSVKFVAGTDDTWYRYDITNAAYIDNITVAPNTIESVEIYPKGLQETFINGDKIQFSAKALRSDGSVIPDKNVTWTATGGNIDNNGLFSPGTETGTFTVTAVIDGKTASNKTIKVHSADYLTEPVTINGYTFTGYTKNLDNVARADTNNITFSDPTPKYSNFTTNGFFVLKGTAKNTNPRVFIRKQGEGALTPNNEYNPDYPYQADIILPSGDFEQRIWLRWGNGAYDVWVEEANVTFYESYDGYEGAWLSWYLPRNAGESTYFYVENKSDFNYSTEDCAYLMPSDNCQCDDFLISNAFNAVIAELPENATLGTKLRALYDWEARTSHYDYVSFTTTSTSKRKRQDAVHVLKYGMGVCEGYANLYTAFARLLGVKAAFQDSANLCHSWTELYYNDEWKMVDVTWDDPSEEMSTDKNPTGENYLYFLIDPEDVSHAKLDNEGKTISPAEFDNVTDYSRAANRSND